VLSNTLAAKKVSTAFAAVFHVLLSLSSRSLLLRRSCALLVALNHRQRGSRQRAGLPGKPGTQGHLGLGRFLVVRLHD
jgi:hypothetical protein